MSEFRLYRRLTDEDYAPVLRPVLGPAPGIPAQCEMVPGEVVEVHVVDPLGSFACERIRVLPNRSAEVWGPNGFLVGAGDGTAVHYPWGAVRTDADGTVLVVLLEAGPHIL